MSREDLIERFRDLCFLTGHSFQRQRAEMIIDELLKNYPYEDVERALWDKRLLTDLGSRRMSYPLIERYVREYTIKRREKEWEEQKRKEEQEAKEFWKNFNENWDWGDIVGNLCPWAFKSLVAIFGPDDPRVLKAKRIIEKRNAQTVDIPF